MRFNSKIKPKDQIPLRQLCRRQICNCISVLLFQQCALIRTTGARTYLPESARPSQQQQNQRGN